MKTACIEILADMVPQVVSVLADAGLKIIGSLDCGVVGDFTFDTVRLVIEEDFGTLLPPECNQRAESPGMPMVRLTIVQEAYGQQKLIRIGQAEVYGYLTRERTFIPAATSPLPDVEQEAARARAAAILKRVAQSV